MSGQFSWELFNQLPIIGIMRNIPQRQMEEVAKIFHRSGFTSLEITMNSVGAEETITSLSGAYQNKLNIGAGTVCNISDLEKALNAGAGFIVTPIIDGEVIKACAAQNIPIFPGAHTPTEIYKAWRLGASMVKVFPSVTPAYIKEVLGPLNYIGLVPTGGVNLENFTGYFAAGAKAVGIGSHLFPKDVIENGDWGKLADVYASFITKYKTYTDSKL